MTAKLFEAALGIAVLIDFKPGSRFVVAGDEGVHPVYDSVSKTLGHRRIVADCRRSMYATTHREFRQSRLRLG